MNDLTRRALVQLLQQLTEEHGKISKKQKLPYSVHSFLTGLQMGVGIGQRTKAARAFNEYFFEKSKGKVDATVRWLNLLETMLEAADDR